jgi:mannose-6-phosphate isomerase-like protein (cupin superfamily)
MKHGYEADIETLTRTNTDFRRVLYTGKASQLVLMSLLPNEEIGLEVHPNNDQFFRFEKGEGKMVINGFERIVRDGDAVIVPMGAEHNVINISETERLQLYTIYAPAHHKDGTVHVNKAEAERSEEHFDGKTTEGD